MAFMMNETSDNLFKALSELATQPTHQIYYRLYYDNDGNPLFYTNQDEPGNYIDLDPDVFRNPPKRVKVKDGKLIELKAPALPKLVPSQNGVSCHPENVTIVVEESQPHVNWSLKTYEES